MKLSELEQLKGLSEQQAYEVYKLALAVYKKDNSRAYKKKVFPTIVGGALGALIGTILKDTVFGGIKLPISLLPIVICAGVGGAFGGHITMKRLLEAALPLLADSRKTWEKENLSVTKENGQP